MSKSININSVKLETALKKKFKTDRLKTISRALGFKDNALNEALRRGTISSKMSEALDRFGIDCRNYAEITLSEAFNPEEDKFTSETQGALTAQTGADNAVINPIYKPSEPSQMSIDDLEVIRHSELKNLIKAAIIELFNVSRFEIDSIGRVTITLSPEALKDLKIEEATL